MARWLAIDWDHDQWRVAMVVAARQRLAVEKTIEVPLAEPLTPANGEALGRKLRDELKAAGVAPAPLLACVGRDRVVIKELRYPPVPAAEEPALVRFQAAKELSEQADDVVLDYAPLSPADQPGERQALVVALKKATATAFQALARGLGVKLVGLTTRPQALLGAVARAQALGRGPTGDTWAVLAIGTRWAELSIQHQGRIVFSRSLARGNGLTAEIKRNLQVFAATNPAVPTPDRLLLTGQRDADLGERLREGLGLEVQILDPLLEGESAGGDTTIWSAAVGVAYLWWRHAALPINFAAPKQPRAAVDTGQRRKWVLALGAAAALLAFYAGSQLVLSRYQREVADRREEQLNLETTFKRMAQDKLDVEALKEWHETGVSWLDELYDLAARFPILVGVRLKNLTAETAAKRPTKDAPIGHLSFTVVAKATQEAEIHKLLAALNSDKHLKAVMRQQPAGEGTLEYLFKVDISRQEPSRYATVLSPPPRLYVAPTAADPAETTEPMPDTPANDDPGEKGGGQ
ncbi:MAG: hypothetical protein NZO58_11370 [Gemmataceae bacterium]|nr:hypothetical protein [Gemmataceae bacterium]